MQIITSQDGVNFPKGLVLYRGILDKEKCIEIYNIIDNLEWDNSLSRKVQHYGYSYDYNLREPQTRKLKVINKSVPFILKCIADALYDTQLLKDYPNQIIVNKYEPGQGIGAHRDHNPIFGDSIATISLGSNIEMEFKAYKDTIKDDNIYKLYLQVGDILIFSDDARMFYSHEIKQRKSDKINGINIKRGTRISLTFRHVNIDYRDE